jgi:hypothetical protein
LGEEFENGEFWKEFWEVEAEMKFQGGGKILCHI